MMGWAKQHPVMSFFLALAGLGTAVTIGREATNPGITMKQANAAMLPSAPAAATPAQVAATPATTVAAGLVHKVGKWPHLRIF